MDRRLRQLVLERARFCCEYCQMPQVFSDAGHEMDHTIAISAGTPMAAPAGETGAWRGRSGRLTSSCPNTPWRPSRPSRCRIVQDFKKVRHGEPNVQDQPVGAIDLPCEKPPTPTRLHLIVRRRLGFADTHPCLRGQKGQPPSPSTFQLTSSNIPFRIRERSQLAARRVIPETVQQQSKSFQ